MTPSIQTFKYGEHTVTLETGVIARQATAAVMVDMEGTVVLVTVVAAKTVKPGQDFFPLSVHYQERMYAAGKIPGGFLKREGRPSETEVLTSRLIDRPIRPLFPKEFMNEVQVIATVLSLNPAVTPDIPAMMGASAALALSGLPFEGPIAGARVGYVEGQFVLNPSLVQLEVSDLDLVVAGTSTSVLMVESEARQLSESTMLEAVMFGHRHMQVVIQAIEALVADAGKSKWELQAVFEHGTFKQTFEAAFKADIIAAYGIREKQVRQNALSEIRQNAVARFVVEGAGISAAQVLSLFSDTESDVVRGRILEGELRIDGRDTETIRPITVCTHILPRTHGSALFTRGETQALVVITLGTGRDAQETDEIAGRRKDGLMLHYNFPPYSVGEIGMMGSPKRREIGHGRLAKRALMGVLPSNEEFPYVLRAVSEITESNGSSSMATVCGASLALMDAGVPISAPVAGIAMGLIKEGDRFAVLSDILGDEDHLGDMDFKVAGTAKGVTALQMDIKINGITRDIMKVALEQARAGRLHILGIMTQAISEPRQEFSEFAPRVYTFKISQDKIRDVIGKGGSVIKQLSEESGASIEISEEGRVIIVANDAVSGERLKERIVLLTAEVEVGRIYEGVVTRIEDYGFFANILPGKDGLVHVSQISNSRVEDVSQVVQVGDKVLVRVLDIDRMGRVKLSMKDVEQGQPQSSSNTESESGFEEGNEEPPFAAAEEDSEEGY